MRAIVRKLKPKLKKTDAVERCGLILKDGTVVTTENIHPNPENGFTIPAKQLAKHEDNLLGSWHTHLGSSIYSMEDHRGFNQWPGLIHFIVGTDGVRAYRVEDGLIREVDLAAG